jgi:hypothetical protein
MTQWGLDTLFNPAKRHMDEEKRRLQSTREEIGDSSGGKRIDLESGKVTIQRKTQDGEPESDDAADKSPQSPQPAPDDGPAPSAKPRPAPSAAAIRAAKRRGREPK